jgi:regulator of sigma E protease
VIGFLETTGAFIVVLGILVFVHELGHFLAAKNFGIAVPVFSLGFGPRLFGFKRRETDYRVSLIPLGGYVRMAGDESDEQRTGAPEEFLSRPRWQRFVVFVAGAAFNIVLAVLVTWLALWSYGKDEIRVPEKYPVVARVVSGSSAERAGIEPGDRVLLIAGADARNPAVRFEHELMSPNAEKTVVVEREGTRREIVLNMDSDPRYHLGNPGWLLILDSDERPVIDGVVPGSVAEAAGIQVGDAILAVDGREPVNEQEFRAILSASPGRPVALRVERAGAILEIQVVPRSEGGRGMIGVVPRPAGLVHRDLPFWTAGVEAIRVNVELSQRLFLTLRKLVGGEVSVRSFSGPLEIARFSRVAVQRLESFLGFLAFISLQLGILNLLPIPVLDGGHILILAVEGLMRRNLSDRVKERVMQAGLLFLLAFFGIVMYFDFIKTFFSS